MVQNIHGVEYEIPDDDLDNLMTIEEVAEALGYSTSTLRNWRSTGNHPLMNHKAIRLNPRSIRWRVKDVNEWIAGIGYETTTK